MLAFTQPEFGCLTVPLVHPKPGTRMYDQPQSG